jgi:hypothetical protein
MYRVRCPSMDDERGTSPEVREVAVLYRRGLPFTWRGFLSYISQKPCLRKSKKTWTKKHTVPFRESVAKCLTAQVRETVMTYSDDHASEYFAKHTSQLSNSKQLLRLFREHSSELPIRNYPQIRLCTNSQDEAHDEQHAFTTLYLGH